VSGLIRKVTLTIRLLSLRCGHISIVLNPESAQSPQLVGLFIVSLWLYESASDMEQRRESASQIVQSLSFNLYKIAACLSTCLTHTYV